ncbi:MAG: hypothetical protein I4N51_00940 [Acinetobacter sp.]|nr:hypothetical protein [Acinetobacter sp.]
MPVYFTVRKLVDPATGQVVGAFVPNSDEDKNYLRERQYREGERIRAVLTKPRNERFNRLVHGMGHLIVENIEGYESLRAHDAIKKLQSEGRIHCSIETLSVEGMDIQRYVPKSISFDSMDEHSFQDFWNQCCKYLIEKHWPTLDEDALTEMIEFQSFTNH